MLNAIEVYIDSKNTNLNRKFTYLVTSEQFSALQIGMLVIVPLSKGEQLAYVANKVKVNPNKLDYEIKYIININKEQSLTPIQITQLQYLMETTMCSFIEALDLVSPRKMRNIYRDDKQIKTREELKVDAYQLLELSTDKDINTLFEIGELHKIYFKADLLKQLAIKNINLSPYKWTKAVKQGNLKKVSTYPSEVQVIKNQEIDSTLTKDQLACLKQITNNNHDVLLHGKTGSGKTEIIKYFIDESKSINQILIVEPNKLLAMQIYQRFLNEFGHQVCLYNASQNTKQMRQNYELIKSGEIKIVISTLHGIFAPFKKLDLVIVDEEHDQSYYYRQPSFHLHEIIRVMQKQRKIKTILLSATPSFESIARASKNYYELVSLPESYSKHNTEVKLQEISSYDYAISVETLMQMRETLSKGNKVIIYHNARGYASSVECETCLRVPHCPNCNESLNLYADDTLRCHNCNFKIDFTNHCSRCNSDDSYKMIGIGIEQVVENIQKYFTDYPIHKIDSTTSEQERIKFLDDFKEEGAQILIGTNLILHGIDFKQIELAVVTNVDYSIRSGNVYQEEQVYQNLVQLMGRIGKGLTAAKILIQTKVPNANIFSYLLTDDYMQYYKYQYEQRYLLGKYPFKLGIKICILHQNFDRLMHQKNYLAKRLSSIQMLSNYTWKVTKRKRIGNEFYSQVELVYEVDKNLNLDQIRTIINQSKFEDIKLYFDSNFINNN